MDKEQLIANYFSAALTEDERLLFESLMSTDPIFKQEVEFQQQLKNAIIKTENDRLKQKLEALEKELGARKPKKLWWAIAASVVIVVTGSLYFLNDNPSNDDLFEAYYQPAQNIVHPIVRDGEHQSELTNAFIAYQKKDYKRAQQLFKSLYESKEVSSLLFYEAICLLETNNLDLAIEKLEAHRAYTDVMTNMTNWYLALAYIKKDELKRAEEVLQDIVSDKNGHKYKEAKQLLKQL